MRFSFHLVVGTLLCKLPIFQHFRNHVEVVLSEGKLREDAMMHMALLHKYKRVVLEMCPEAILLLQVVQLEAFAPMYCRAPFFQHLLLDAGALYHNVQIENKLNETHWMVSRGLERIYDITARCRTAASYEVDMVLNTCNVKDRLGMPHFWWFLEGPLVEENLLSEVNLFVYIVDAPHCQLEPENILTLARHFKTVTAMRYKGGPGREEQSGFLKYILDNYRNLEHRFVIFTHPDAHEHQGDRFDALRRVLRILRTGSAYAHDALQFVPLSVQRVVAPLRTYFRGSNVSQIEEPMRTIVQDYLDANRMSELNEADWLSFWHRLFSDGSLQNICPSGCTWNTEMSEALAFYVASQVLVHGSKLVQHPKSYYEYLYTDLPWLSRTSGYFEAVWHVLLGEPLHTPERSLDPRLPLALKWGLWTKMSYGKDRVI